METQATDLAQCEPILQVPISLLKGDRRCHVCRLFYDDPDAFVEISSMLVRGDNLREVVVPRALELGYRFSDSQLSAHRKKHLDEAMWRLAAETKEFETLARQALSIPTGDLAQAQVKIGCIAIIRALKSIKPDALLALAKQDPVGLIDFAAKHAKALAAVQSADRIAALNEAKLQLEKIRLDQNGAALLTRAMQALHKELSSSPEGVTLLQAIEKFVNAPKP